MKLAVFYNGEFGRTVIGNLINYSGFCISCGDACTQCKTGKYSCAENLVGIVEMVDPNTLDDFIDDPEPYLPKNIPKADIAVVINVHPDILFSMLPKLLEAGYKGIIGCSESPKELPLGLRVQLEEKATEIGLEASFTKPFCAMRPELNKPIISAFLKEARVGEPMLEITLQKGRMDTILFVDVIRSAPCGSTWYIAKRLIGVETIKEEIWERISEAHHAYPCTASMDRDLELNDTILHKAGYIVRDAVMDALLRAKMIR